MKQGTENRCSAYARELAHTSWANTDDRAARTRAARNALEKSWLVKAGGDVRKAESLRKAYYSRLGRLRAEARRKGKAS